MQIGPYTLSLTRTKALAPLASVETRGGWWPIIRESATLAWQRNTAITVDTVMSFSAVYACVTLIASDIAKMRLRLVAVDDNGIWTETESAAFSPLLRKPNRYQTRVKFFEWWHISKLLHGNTYALKQRDARGVVVALYILNPLAVRPLIAPDGSVFYELKRDELNSLTDEVVIVPAREIIHDVMIPLFHPLVGVSPIYACGLAAVQGIKIQTSSERFFANGSNPGGVLTAPGNIAQETADRIKTYWDTNFSGVNAGKVAVLGDGLTYEAMTVKAVDAQLIEQLRWTAEDVCRAFHVPPHMISVGSPPTYTNIEALQQGYYSQCLQSLIEALELTLDEGLELPKPYGTEFDLDDLIRMDTGTKVQAAATSIGAGVVAPNEARKKYFGLGPVEGGDSVYLQQQNFSLAALAERDREAPFAKPAAPPAGPAALEAGGDAEKAILTRKTLERLRRAG